MIVIDSSVLVAILKREPIGENCAAVAREASAVHIAAPTLTEVLIVAHSRGFGDELARLLVAFEITVVPLTKDRARSAAAAYARWGKGFSPAALNFGDCFAYALAQELNAPLLFVGKDFAQTDVTPALPPAA